MHRPITKRLIEAIAVPDATALLLRDTIVTGFGLRISPKGTKTFDDNRASRPAHTSLPYRRDRQ